jgi:hypothetical protein
MPVPALDRHEVRDAEPAGGEEDGPAGRVAVLRVQDVERTVGVLGPNRRHHGVDVALEIARPFLLAGGFESDHPDARHRGRGAAAIDAGAEGVGRYWLIMVTSCPAATSSCSRLSA